jgi:hypothetical protein
VLVVRDEHSDGFSATSQHYALTALDVANEAGQVVACFSEGDFSSHRSSMAIKMAMSSQAGYLPGYVGDVAASPLRYGTVARVHALLGVHVDSTHVHNRLVVVGGSRSRRALRDHQVERCLGRALTRYADALRGGRSIPLASVTSIGVGAGTLGIVE